MARAIQKLNARHAAFVAEFVLCLNATQAAIKAGYAAKSAAVQGSQLLRYPKIAEAIEKARTRALVRCDFDKSKVLSELGLLAFSDIDNYMVDETGKLIAAPNAQPGVMRAVSSVKYRTVTDDEGNVERTVEFKLWDKPGTLKLAGRHVGLFPSKDKEQIKAEAEAMVQAMLDAARKKRDAEGEVAAVPQRDEARMIDATEAKP